MPLTWSLKKERKKKEGDKMKPNLETFFSGFLFKFFFKIKKVGNKASRQEAMTKVHCCAM